MATILVIFLRYRERLEKLGVCCTLQDLGKHIVDGKELPLPPVLFGQLGDDKSKKTVLVYGHVDVQPAAKSDGWNTDPFTLTEKNEKLYGRGSSDDKGPVLCWLHAVEMLQKQKINIPVNIKFCFEAMEESGSIGLAELLERNKNDFLAGVDFVCISDSYWLGTTKPCLTHGLRGICSFQLEVTGIQQDLHSGVYGGVVHEPLQDLVWMMSQLTSVENRILIPGIYDDVAPMSKEEHELYDSIDFCVKEFRESVGAKKLPTEDKKTLLIRRWREPCLSLHGIEGAFSGAGEKTVIPSKVIGKFSIRIVPNMKPEKVNKLVVDFLNDLWRKRGSPNTFNPRLGHDALPWVADTNDANFKAVHGVDPDYIREGCSIPITLTFQELTGKSVLLLPLGAADDMAHSQNEKMNKINYIQGVKTLLAYLLELGKV
ncbi:peptidase dimerization domain protein [Necator americanus]|uniref:Peptidase dimerization domain protein n=1 Tax=Necator americanus TaxID=51031 RepID=W2SSC4_NECAM|nr:peptidase dimerization domain protein [Necator americanus]ETN72398.1 peptidase dimerization domain protein [Necator americanus]